MDVFDLVAKITLDTSEYEQSLSRASTLTRDFGKDLGATTDPVKVFGSAFGVVTRETSTAEESTSAFSESINELKSMLEQGSDSIEAFAEGALQGIDEAAAEVEAANGEFSDLMDTLVELGAEFRLGDISAEDFAAALLGISLDADGATSSTDDLAEAAFRAQSETNKAGSATSFFGDMIKANLGGDIIKKGISMLKDLVVETAQYGDTIDKSSQKLGISSKAYQEWDAVLQHSGASMSSMSATFKTLANAVQDASADQEAAFKRLGLSLDDLKTKSTEDVFSEVIFALQRMESGTERTAIATDLLGRGAMEMGALLNTSAEDTQAMIDRVNELGGVMSEDGVKTSAEFQDSLQDFKTAASGFGRDIGTLVLPVLTELMNTATDAAAAMRNVGIDKTVGDYENVADKIRAAKDNVAEWNEKLERAQKFGENTSYQLKGLANATEQLTAILEDAGTKTSVYDQIISGELTAAEAADLLGISLEDVERELETYREQTRAAAEQTEDAADEMADLTARMEAHKEAAKKVTDAMETLAGSYPGLTDALDRFGVKIETASAWLVDNGMTADEWAGKVTSAVGNVINGFDPLSTSLDMSLEEMANSLSNNIQAYNNWNSNIQKLMAAAADTGDQSAVDFVNYMMDLGVGAADQVAAMVDDVDGTMATFAPLFADATDAGMLAVYNGIEGGKAQAVTAGEEVSEAANDALGSADTESTGANLTHGVARGMRSSAAVSAVVSAGQYVSNAANNAMRVAAMIHSPSRLTAPTGEFITKGVATGMVSSDAIRSLHESADKLTGETVKDLETMVKAWNDVYDSYYEGLKHQNFFLEISGDTDQIVANYRTIQRTLHEQKEHYLALGVDANSKAIRQMEEDWWKYQKNIVSTISDAYDAVLSGLEHSLFLAEKNGKSATERIEILRNLQKATHEEAEELRRLGYSETSAEIMAAQKRWWGYEDEVKSIAAEEMETWEQVAKAMQDAYDQAFNEIADKRDQMKDKLSGYADLFTSYSGYNGPGKFVILSDLDKQTSELEKYGDMLDSLRERGVNEGLMQQILGMSVDDANSFAYQLMKLSDAQWDKYMDAFERNQTVAEDIANRYYQPEFDALNGQSLVEISPADQKQLEYSEEEVSLLSRIAEAIQNGTQKVEFKIGERVIAEATFDELVAVGKSRGMDIVNAKVG